MNGRQLEILFAVEAHEEADESLDNPWGTVDPVADEAAVELTWRIEWVLDTPAPCEAMKNGHECKETGHVARIGDHQLLAEGLKHMDEFTKDKGVDDALRVKTLRREEGGRIVSRCPLRKFRDLQGEGASNDEADADLFRKIANKLDPPDDAGGDTRH